MRKIYATFFQYFNLCKIYLQNKQNLSEFTRIAAEIFKDLDILKENYLELISSPENNEILKRTREIHLNQAKIVNEIEKIPEKVCLTLFYR